MQLRLQFCCKAGKKKVRQLHFLCDSPDFKHGLSYVSKVFCSYSMLLRDDIPRMKLINGKIEVTVFAPCYISHIIYVELLE